MINKHYLNLIGGYLWCILTIQRPHLYTESTLWDIGSEAVRDLWIGTAHTSFRATVSGMEERVWLHNSEIIKIGSWRKDDE